MNTYPAAALLLIDPKCKSYVSFIPRPRKTVTMLVSLHTGPYEGYGDSGGGEVSTDCVSLYNVDLLTLSLGTWRPRVMGSPILLLLSTTMRSSSVPQ